MTQEMLEAGMKAINEKQNEMKRKAYDKIMEEVIQSSNMGIATKYLIGEALWEYFVGEERTLAETFERYVK